MYKVKVNNKHDFSFEKKDGAWLSDGKDFAFDLIEVKENSFHIIKNHKSYNAEVVSHNASEKTFQVKVNQTIYSISVKDRYDELLHQLGMDKALANKFSNIKAPMPGMVLNILVGEGANVKKGDALLILEAMKMENILKSPADGIVKKVSVKKGMAVEKNQILIEF
ncbi:MAG TPA: acetyl-CoA carboxylase biotin carboxyl carrier protein subunit [Bacteroidia bacterium]|jgi:biotin carboxyl carrier protein|nr:acetyl-CoA carboxylase biotin carboxyl carrier protein subunit [Bacteroidia bacterium]